MPGVLNSVGPLAHVGWVVEPGSGIEHRPGGGETPRQGGATHRWSEASGVSRRLGNENGDVRMTGIIPADPCQKYAAREWSNGCSQQSRWSLA